LLNNFCNFLRERRVRPGVLEFDVQLDAPPGEINGLLKGGYAFFAEFRCKPATNIDAFQLAVADLPQPPVN
jgi:hypothetical protein